MKHFIIVLVGIILLSGCTANQRSKYFGGKMDFNLPSGKKLVNVTWKDNSMWYLTRSMRSNEVAEVYEFCEKSGYGVIEGKIVIRESK